MGFSCWLNGSVFQMLLCDDWSLLARLRHGEGCSAEIFKTGRFGGVTAFTIGGLSSLVVPGRRGSTAGVLTFLGRLAGAVSGGCPLGARRLPHLDLRAPGDQADLLGPAVARSARPGPARRCRGTEWAALVILVFVIVFFGVRPGRARPGGHGDHAGPEPPSRAALMAVLGSPLMLELGLGALILVVFFAGLFQRTDDRRSVGVVASSASPCCSACRGAWSPVRRCSAAPSSRTTSRSSPSGSSWSPRSSASWARSACGRRPSRGGRPSTTWPSSRRCSACWCSPPRGS